MNKSIFAFFSLILFAFALTVTACSVVYAGNGYLFKEDTEDKVIMVVADYLNIEDINRMEFMSRLTEKSSTALMNNRQTGKASAAKSKLIIGSGKKLELSSDMSIGADSENRVDISELRRKNKNSGYLDYIGYIGDAANKNNGKVCFLGNADEEKQNRSSMFMAIDSSGEIDLRETDGVLIKDDNFPYGKRTNYKKLAELYKQYLPASSFMVIETGDMERLESFRASLSQESYELYKSTVLSSIDGFLKEIVSHGGFKTLIFVSTYPSKVDSAVNDRLTPVVVYGSAEGGMLYSANTRREGIILNTDLADYILFKLGYLSSSAVQEVKRENARYALVEMNRKITRTSVLRAPVLTSYAAMVIMTLCVFFAIAAFFRNGNRSVLSKLSSFFAYIMISYPIVLLYMPASYLGDSIFEYMFFTVAVSAIFSAVLQIMLKDKIRVIFSICILMLFGLSADIIAGSPMIKQSVLGYDPVIGARFYGIGNEYAGMFAGCSLMAAGCFQEIRGRKLNRGVLLIFFTACSAILGLSFLGANFGGALAGAAGYMLAYFLVFGIKFNKRNLIIGIMILAATGAVLMIADSLGITSPSHMGRLIKDAGANGIGVIISTIQRKLSMNLRLIRYTIWTKVLLSIIAIIAFMFFRPGKQLQMLFDRYKYLRCSWIGIATASITGFAVNDSGIVVAATAMIYTAFTMLIMSIGERTDTGYGIQNAGKYRP